MPTAPNAVEKAIRETHASLMSAGLSADLAERGTREIVAAALAKAMGSKRDSTFVGNGRTRDEKKKKKGGSARGPKPGGRQLKAHIGGKAFDALDDATKDKARKAISKVGPKWKALSKEEQEKILAPALKGAE